VVEIIQKLAPYLFGLGWDLGKLLGGSNAANTAFNALIEALGSLVTGIQQVFSDEKQAWGGAVNDAAQGAYGFALIGDALSHAEDRLIDDIIPRSLWWLDQQTHEWVHAWYDPTISALWGWIAGLNNRLNVVEQWRRVRADPSITSYWDTRAWFFTWPYAALVVLDRWLRNPGLCADWLSPWLPWPLVSVLNQNARGPERHAWLDMLLWAARDNVWDVEYTVLAMLQSERY
jgi:hypothetical protein